MIFGSKVLELSGALRAAQRAEPSAGAEVLAFGLRDAPGDRRVDNGFMAAHTAGLRIPRRRVEHIQALTAEIGARERIIAHLLALVTRTTVYFFTVACLTAALITYINGKHTAAVVWGSVGLVLVVLLVGVKGGRLLLRRVIAALREEITETESGESRRAGRTK